MTNLADSRLPRYRLTVDQFHRMGETGIFRPEARVELIEGEIIDMARHAFAVAELTRRVILRSADRAFVWTQNPIVLSGHSELQPDIALLRPDGERYRLSHPRPDDVLLLVEVADTTLCYDREVKLPLYARHRISEVWIVDLAHHAVIACTDAVGDAYADVRSLVAPIVLAPRRLPDCVVDVGGIL